LDGYIGDNRVGVLQTSASDPFARSGNGMIEQPARAIASSSQGTLQRQQRRPRSLRPKALALR
jgi:hypothetical protein